METRHRILSFDRFELDLGRYELRRAGRRIKLQRVPMELLILLVEKEGALTSREEIVARLWAPGALADTERSINTAVRKIRQALDDDVSRPRFVETVVGKGYRFVALVSSPLPAVRAAAVADPPVPESPPAHLPDTARPVSWNEPRTGIVLAAVAAAITIGVYAMRPLPRSAEPMKIVPFTALPGAEFAPAFSPDGNQVAFAWTDQQGENQHIYVKAVDNGSTRKLTGAAEFDSDPAWSPDGRWIAFLRKEAASRMSVYLTPADGGSERRIGALHGPHHFRPAWSQDGSALAVMDSQAGVPGLFRLSIDTGQERRLTTAPATASGDWSPAFSPDGRTLAFLRNGGSALTGHLYSLKVDPTGLAIGQPQLIQTDRADLTGLDWSADGRSLVSATHAGMFRVPASGGPAERLPFPDASQQSVSRRSNRLVFAQSVRDTDIFRTPGPDGSDTIAKLISSTRADGAPGYSPDGRRVVFVSERTGSEQLWLSDSDGQHLQQLTFLVRGAAGCPRWSPDGRRVAFDSTEQGSGNIYVIDVEGGATRQITSGPSTNVRPAWSRDGAWIYFGSDRSGSWEVWKTTPQSANPTRVTHGGGREAFEDRQGAFLYYTKERNVPGIWRIPASGGVAEHFSEEGEQGRWGVGERGLYYVNSHGGLELLEFSTRRKISVPTPGLLGTGSGGGLLSVGPGDRSMLVTILVRSDSDLTLVENFR